MICDNYGLKGGQKDPQRVKLGSKLANDTYFLHNCVLTYLSSKQDHMDLREYVRDNYERMAEWLALGIFTAETGVRFPVYPMI